MHTIAPKRKEIYCFVYVHGSAETYICHMFNIFSNCSSCVLLNQYLVRWVILSVAFS